jgi:hypothetical protein
MGEDSPLLLTCCYLAASQSLPDLLEALQRCKFASWQQYQQQQQASNIAGRWLSPRISYSSDDEYHSKG